MIDFVFFAKTFALTMVVVMLMQIQVGNQTIETHAMSWVQSSVIVEPLRGAARGAARMAHDLGHRISNGIHDNVSESKNKKEESQIKKESSFRWLHSFKDKKSTED